MTTNEPEPNHAIQQFLAEMCENGNLKNLRVESDRIVYTMTDQAKQRTREILSHPEVWPMIWSEQQIQDNKEFLEELSRLFLGTAKQ